ncbi:hypothetical protein M6D81_01345 [Paenibacillus sp. J5C_2022]|uniref:hypothetical protein n=1 Tax=Paenibacillus sp. J5C2022 TaxID=2977129 RepID=UPI0021D1CA85|nr:hypothetical protein [Paenibacillus sp. J5C2022]MCU6707340.1 hypothetical protein [Paenibacillus sp. J5C2022]
MENSRKLTYVIIGLIILLIMSIYQNGKLKSEMEHLHSRISNMEANLNQGINNLQYSISNQVEHLLNEQQSVVADYKSSYTSVDADKETVETLVEFTLKEAEAGSTVSLQATTLENSEDKQFECATENGLQYACEAALSYKHDYTLDLFQKSADGSNKKLNSRSYTNHLKGEFLNRVSISESGTSTDKEGTQYSFSLRNKTFGEPEFQIQSVIVKAFYADKEVFTKDVTAYSIANAEERNKMRLMIASGEIAPADLPDLEYNQASIDDNDEESGYYIVTVLHADTGAEVRHNDFPEYSFKVTVTLKNGEVFEL